jgi:nicotinate-nucleotide pyrophosphorylase (carboxylating)
VGGFSLLLDVEVTTEAEADEAIDAGADVIMLDNMEGDVLVSTAARLKERWSGKRKFLIETSGGIEEKNLQERAINGMFFMSTRHTKTYNYAEVDILSTSAVHQSVQHIDFSLKVQIPKKNG